MYRVFRIETKDGDSVYKSMIIELDKYNDLLEKHCSDCDAFPTRFEDYNCDNDNELYSIKEGWNCSFRFCTISACQFLYWFGEFLDKLCKDFSIYIYCVSKIQIGKSGLQAIFNVNDVISKTQIYL